MRRRTKRALAAALAGAAVAAVPVIVIALFVDRGPSPTERRAVVAYNDVVRPLGVDGGRIVILGIRAGIRDLQAGRVTPQAFRSEAEGWRRGMERVRLGFAAVPVPRSLRRAAALFDQSLREYVRAIDAFVAASFSSGDDLARALAEAIPIAERADATFDHAKALLKAELERVGEGDRESL